MFAFPRITAVVTLAATLACLGLPVIAMAHKFDLNLYTYFDVKIAADAVDQVLAWTKTAAVDNGSLTGLEYMGYVGELDNHLLYRMPKTAPASDLNSVDSHGHLDSEQEEKRNKQIVDAISAFQGVLNVDIQTLRQRAKRDEL